MSDGDGTSRWDAASDGTGDGADDDQRASTRQTIRAASGAVQAEHRGQAAAVAYCCYCAEDDATGAYDDHG